MRTKQEIIEKLEELKKESNHAISINMFKWVLKDDEKHPKNMEQRLKIENKHFKGLIKSTKRVQGNTNVRITSKFEIFSTSFAEKHIDFNLEHLDELKQIIDFLSNFKNGLSESNKEGIKDGKR